MSLVDAAVTVLGSTVNLNVSDDNIFDVDLWLLRSCGKGVLDKLDEELSRLLWPSGAWAAPLVSLSVVWDTFVVTEERNGPLVVDDLLEVLDSLGGLHSLDSTTSFEHWLEVNAFWRSPGLKSLLLITEECVLFAHSERLDQGGYNRIGFCKVECKTIRKLTLQHR